MSPRHAIALVTERLRLRPVGPADVDALVEALAVAESFFSI